MTKQMQTHRAFTLIELLITIGVIGLLAAIVILAVNPQKQLNAAEDAKRRSYAKQIQNALQQDIIESARTGTPSIVSVLPQGMANAEPICRTGAADTSDCADLTQILNVILPSLPVDRLETDPDHTGYVVFRDEAGTPTVQPAHLAAGSSSSSSSAISSQGGGGGASSSSLPPGQIATCQGLQNIQNNLGASYTIVADFNCAGFDFAPIGSDVSPFTGTIDGQGHTITNLSINRPALESVGLVARLNGTIENIVFSNVTIRGDIHVGTVAGRSFGTIDEINVTSGTVQGAGLTGGITGHQVDGTIEDITSALSVTCTASGYCGGIAAYSNNIIARARTSGPVSGQSDVGGIAGGCLGCGIGDVYSSATISATGQRAGGIVGLVGNDASGNGNVSNAYATGNVSGTVSVGGFVGEAMNVSFVNDSLAFGNATGSSNVGGFIGTNGGNVERCWYTGSPDNGQCNFEPGGQSVFHDMDAHAVYMPWDRFTVWQNNVTALPTFQ